MGRHSGILGVNNFSTRVVEGLGKYGGNIHVDRHGGRICVDNFSSRVVIVEDPSRYGKT